MIGYRTLLENRAMALSVLSAGFVILLCVVLVTASITGTISGRLGFATASPAELPPDSDIAGWASFDKASYLPGEPVTYEIRVLWRKDAVAPDLDTFRSSISFFPFDYRNSAVDKRSRAGGIREHVLTYSLQAVNVDSPASYQFDLATLYYASSQAAGDELRSLRIRPPPVHIGEFYPRDISDIPLKGLQGEIRDARSLRQGLMTMFALALASIAGLLLWQHGRKRPDSALSEAERLWLELRRLKNSAANDQQYMLESERIFTHALRLRSAIGPAAFWSDKDASFGEWQDSITRARRLFAQNYSETGPAPEDPDRAAAIVGELLDPLISAERLLREQQPSFATRLRQEPAVLATAVSFSVLAVAILVLAALPAIWTSPDVRRYNEAIRLIEQDGDLEEAFVQLGVLVDDSDDDAVRAATLYNLGTLGVDHRLTNLSELQQQEFLRAIFVPQKTLDGMLHALEMDAEAELLTMLGDSVRRYVEAEEAMKGAVRISPDHEDGRRNLEILGKVRRALGDTLAQLVQQAEEGEGSVEMQRQSVIDLRKLMETELPEDFSKLDAGKDDSNYLILEGF